MSSNIERFIERRLGELTAERDEARTEAAHLRAELSGLEDHFNRVTAERVRYRLAIQAIRDFRPDPRHSMAAADQVAAFTRLKIQETLGATPGEGGGAR